MKRLTSKQTAGDQTRRERRSVRAAVQSLEARRLLAADLVISEFLASNNANIADNFGVRSDWIEIYNRGDAAASLQDYYLTDDAAVPAKWRFPTQSLAAGAYLVVWASDRNLAVAGQPLHTNFKLSAGGEYLGLMRTDGTPQFEYSPAFPQQSTDVSYGLVDVSDPASDVQFFGTPTPGAVNSPSAADAVFSTPGKIFSGTLQLTLLSPTPGAQIRYTTNRTTPTSTSTLYTGPITLTSTTVIRTRVFAAGYAASQIVGHSFVRVDTTTANFDTNLGVVVVDTHGSAMNDSTMVMASAAFIDNAGDGRANMLEDPDYLGRIGIRVRGSTSQTFPKQQFAVEIWDEANQDRDVPLLGMPAESDWILYAPYAEKSLMQNALAFDWAREMGAWAPRVKFVELYLNTSGATTLGSGQYWGVYMLVEKIKIGGDRLDIAELGASDNTEPDISGGYLWKKDRTESNEQVITTASGIQFAMVEPETLTTQQTTYLTSYLNAFEAALNGANFADPDVGYAKYIDVDSWIDYWLLTEMAKQIDGFRLSTFYYKDRNGKIAMGPMWDFNLSLGNAYYQDGNNASGWYSNTISNDISSNDYPFYPRLMQDAGFKKKLVDRWSVLRKTIFSDTRLTADIDAYVGELSDHNGNYPVGVSPTQTSNNGVVRNYKRWNVLGTYLWPNGFWDLQGRWIEDVKMMKNWLTGRLSWMDSQLLPAPVASVASGFISAPTSVSLTPHRVNNIDTTLIGATSPALATIPTSNLQSWMNLGYNTTGWLTGNNGVGYDTNTSGIDYNSLIGLNVGSMRNSRTSVFIRIPFNVTDVSTIKSLVLRMRYDDGFIAYLNGHQIAQGNDGAVTNWQYTRPYTSTAESDRDDNLAITAVEWDVSAWKSVLVNGDNVLAIHGLNRTASSSDLLILPELFSRDRVGLNPTLTSVYYTLDGTDPLQANGTTLSPSAQLYFGPIAVNGTTRIKSRSLRAGSWSGLADDYYVLGTDSLRVSEVMYNPSVPANGSFDAQAYEYIELQNVGSTALTLTGYQFTTGIQFTFPNLVLQPGAFTVIAKDLAAFQEKYGTGITPVGTYTGALDNAGEQLVLQDPFGNLAQTFAYDDAWYPTTDGNGAALEALSPGTLDLNLQGSWRPTSVGGTPGSADFIAPTVSSSDYLFDVGPGVVEVRFSEDVAASLDVSDVTLVNLGTSGAFSPTALSYDPGTRVATFTFAAGALGDGNYQLQLNGTGVSDAAGNAMSAYTFDFHILAGDANRDRVVNFNDLLTLARNYNQSGRTFSQGNFDYSADGLVGFNDLLILAKRYGNSLTTFASSVNSTPQAKAPRRIAPELLS